MSQEKQSFFTDEEIRESAQGNVAALSLATMVYLQDNGFQIDAYWNHIGHQFAPFWQQNASSSVHDIARRVALNMVTALCQLKSFDGDENRAEFTLSNWPPDDMAPDFEIMPKNTPKVLEIFRPIMESLSLNYDWQKQGLDYVVTIWR